MSAQHVGERAALYALGALSDRERSEMQAHLRACAACAAEVGRAEDEVSAAVALQPRQPAPPRLDRRVERLLAPPRSRWPHVAALAAAFVLGLLPSLYLWQSYRAPHAVVAAERIAGFAASRPGLSASVTYGRDGSWYVIVARGARRSLQVAWMHDGTRTMLGRATAHDGVAMLYLRKSHPMERLALLEGGRVVAFATLRYD